MNKKILALVWAYFGWVAAALIYNKKNPSDIKKELDTAKVSWKWGFKVLLDDFIEIHQNMLDNLKSRVLTEENREKFQAKKDEILELIAEYRLQWEKILKDLEVKWKDFALESFKKLEANADEKIKELKWKAPEKIDELKEKLRDFFEDLKKKINEK